MFPGNLVLEEGKAPARGGACLPEIDFTQL